MNTMRSHHVQDVLASSKIRDIHLSGSAEHGPVDESTDSLDYLQARINGIVWCGTNRPVDLLLTVVFRDKSVGVWQLTK